MVAPVSGSDLGAWINAPGADPVALDLIASAAAEAVATMIAGAEIPESVHRLAILAAGSDLYERRNAPNGVRMFGPDGEAIRVRNDDLAAARSLLRAYLPPTVT